MGVQALRSLDFSHVVFPSAFGGGGAIDFSRRPDECQPPALGAAEMSFLRWLFQYFGLDAADYRPETLARRLPACLRALRVNSIAQARQLLHDRPMLNATAFGALLVGVTSFYRDRPVFDALRERILPSLMARGRLCVWSAGCANGAELYSVALLLAELGALEGCTLVGTDARPDAIRAAARGQFEPFEFQALPPALVEKYLVRSGNFWQVRPPIRTCPRWLTSSVIDHDESGAWDLILCRNLVMYLQPYAAQAVWRRLEAALRPGGALVVGRAEHPTGASRLSAAGPCLYVRDRD